MSSLRLGSKVRALRRRENVSQTELAGKLDISASYLNLIEHNQRPLPAHLLVKLAQVFHIDIGAFADDSSARLADDLREVFGDPIVVLREPAPTTLNPGLRAQERTNHRHGGHQCPDAEAVQAHKRRKGEGGAKTGT